MPVLLDISGDNNKLAFYYLKFASGEEFVPVWLYPRSQPILS